MAETPQPAPETLPVAATGTASHPGWWSGLDPAMKRPTIIVAAVIVALVVGTQMLNALIPGPAAGGNGSSGGTTNGTTSFDLGRGVSVTPPAGWVVREQPSVLEGIRLQRGGVIVDLLVAPYGGTPTELLSTYADQVLKEDANSLTVHDVVVTGAGNGRPAARAKYDGIFKGSGHLEGELSTQVFGSTGVIVDAAARQGALEGALGDVHQMLGTIEVSQ